MKSRQTKLLVTSCFSKLNVKEHRRGNKKNGTIQTQDVDKQKKKHTTMRKQTQIRHEPSYKQLEEKTNRPSFLYLVTVNHIQRLAYSVIYMVSLICVKSKNCTNLVIESRIY